MRKLISFKPISSIIYHDNIVDWESMDLKTKWTVRFYKYLGLLVGLKMKLEQGEPLEAYSYTWLADKAIRKELKKKFIEEV